MSRTGTTFSNSSELRGMREFLILSTSLRIKFLHGRPLRGPVVIRRFSTIRRIRQRRFAQISIAAHRRGCN
jgi:hypothetical protein